MAYGRHEIAELFLDAQDRVADEIRRRRELKNEWRNMMGRAHFNRRVAGGCFYAEQRKRVFGERWKSALWAAPLPLPSNPELLCACGRRCGSYAQLQGHRQWCRANPNRRPRAGSAGASVPVAAE